MSEIDDAIAAIKKIMLPAEDETLVLNELRKACAKLPKKNAESAVLHQATDDSDPKSKKA